ncbi:MAG: thermonuclease family protein [Clostridia bacterium]|nr:thermonuclease family protein [Clostridia bacterium]
MRRHCIVILTLASLVLAACSSAAPGAPASDRATSADVRTTNPQAMPGDTSGATVAHGEAARQPVSPDPSESRLPRNVTKAEVVRVVDGDTIDVAYLAGATLPARRIRFIGVNTPESTIRHEPYGKEASAFTKRQLQGKTVWLEKDVSEVDKYGRALRYVWLTPPRAQPSEKDIRAHMFNAILVLEGYAQLATYTPDVKYVDAFTKFQREARAAGRGLWGLTDAVSSTSRTSRATSGSTSRPAAGSAGGAQRCDPNYAGACVPPYPPDVDCGDLSARGFKVVGQDVHRLDGDHDGIACER